MKGHRTIFPIIIIASLKNIWRQCSSRNRRNGLQDRRILRSQTSDRTSRASPGEESEKSETNGEQHVLDAAAEKLRNEYSKRSAMRRGEEEKTAKGQKEVETEKRIMQTERKLGSAGKTRNNESRQMLPFILSLLNDLFLFFVAEWDGFIQGARDNEAVDAGDHHNHHDDWRPVQLHQSSSQALTPMQTIGA